MTIEERGKAASAGAEESRQAAERYGQSPMKPHDRRKEHNGGVAGHFSDSSKDGRWSGRRSGPAGRGAGAPRLAATLTAGLLVAALAAGCASGDGAAGGAATPGAGGGNGTEASGQAPTPEPTPAASGPVAEEAGAAYDPEVFPYTAEVYAEGLNVPWEMAFMPDGGILFTERPGRLRLIEDGMVREQPLLELGDPFRSEGEGGLLGLALDPDFEQNGYAYVYHTYAAESGTANRVLRLTVNGEGAEMDKILLDGIPGSQNHNGGRIKFGPDGHLYVTAGDIYEPELAQDEESLGGKILRIDREGGIPADNPFPGSPVYSLGHRNAQGLAWHPDSGELYSSEHGQRAHDEINVIKPGANYGWPEAEGDADPEGRGFTPPLAHSGDETWAPSGMTFITQGPWQGQLLTSGLAGQSLLHTEPGDQAGTVRLWFENEWGRLRNIAEGPDGTLYVMTNNRDGRGSPEDGDDRIIALRPNWHGGE